jgi:hypothetical protein
VTHRIDLAESASELRVSVQGLVDSAALAGIRAVLATARGRRALLVLKEGCEFEPAALECLRRLREQVEVTAESPFLTRWLAEG